MTNLSDFRKMVQTGVDLHLDMHFPDISVQWNLYGNVRQYICFLVHILKITHCNFVIFCTFSH